MVIYKTNNKNNTNNNKNNKNNIKSMRIVRCYITILENVLTLKMLQLINRMRAAMKKMICRRQIIACLLQRNEPSVCVLLHKHTFCPTAKCKHT